MRDTQRKEEGWQFGSEEIFVLWVDEVAEQSILLKQERFTLKPQSVFGALAWDYTVVWSL